VKKTLLIIAVVAVAVTAGVLWYLSPEDRGPSDFDSEEVEVTEYCQPDEDGVWPEGIGEVTSGHSDEYGWAEGGGCVHRSIHKAWAALFNIPELVGDNVDRHSLELLTAEDPYSHQFDIKYEVDNFLTIEWTNRWSHRVVEGTPEDPRVVEVHYRRVEGSDMMPYWEGTILLKRLDDEMTAVFVHNEIDTPRGQETDEETSIRTVKGFFEDTANTVPNTELLKSNAVVRAAD